MRQPLVAVVILNWNGKHFLQQFLPSVLASTYPNLRVVVADNASTDDSIAFLRQEFAAVETIELPRNYGFAGGYNEALQKVEADYFVLLNSDVEVTAGWLEPMIALLEADEWAAGCQPKILSWHQRDQFEYAGGAGGWIDALGYPFARGRVFDVCEKDRGQYNDVQRVFWASGAALVIRSQVFRQLGGFETSFFAHMEEIDLCWRVQRAGYHLLVCPASVVYHVGGGTLPQGNSRKTFLNFRNNLAMLWRNLPLSEKWWKIPLRMGLDQIAALKSLLGGDAGYFRAVLRAHLAFVGNLLRQKTGSVKLASKPLRQCDGVYSGQVIVQYFLRHKKTFADIVKEKI